MNARAGERTGREGYALLALLAASAALLATLALSLPRMAMQAQRVKDERLIERGQQYMRAIKLYYREHNKYPEELDDLEDTDGVRYLRRRYEDPMGDSGEWRIVHMGTDGRFEDSILFDLEKTGAGRTGAFGGARNGGFGAQGGGSLASVQVGATPPGRRGASGYSGPASPLAPTPLTGAARARTARESAAPDLVARERYGQGFGYDGDGGPEGPSQDSATGPDGQPDYSRMLPSNVPMDENERQPDALPGLGGQPRTGAAFGPQARAGLGAARGSQGEEGPGAGGLPARPAGPGAAGLINRLLTTPRPGGVAGAASAASRAAAAPVFERGIAGVASTSEETGVKVYKGKESYREWEFVYDYRKDRDTKGARTQETQAGPNERDVGAPNRSPGQDFGR